MDDVTINRLLSRAGMINRLIDIENSSDYRL